MTLSNKPLATAKPIKFKDASRAKANATRARRLREAKAGLCPPERSPERRALARQDQRDWERARRARARGDFVA